MSEWKNFTHLQPSPTIIPHPLNEYPAKVDVQIRVTEGSQQHIFSGFGSCQRDDDDPNPYGGIVYIYNDREVKLYTPVDSAVYLTNNDGVFAFTGKKPNVVQVECNMQYLPRKHIESRDGWRGLKKFVGQMFYVCITSIFAKTLGCVNLPFIPFPAIQALARILNR